MAPPKGFVPWNKDTKGLTSRNSTSFKKGINLGFGFKKGNKPHNKDKHIRLKQICSICNNLFQPMYDNKIYCSVECKYKSPEWIKNLSESHKGYVTSENTKQKLRLIRQEQIDKDGGIVQIGKYEKQILDYVEGYLKTPIIRQFRTSGYFIDGYSPIYNLAIEIDEAYHNNQIEKDKEREQNIKNELNCVFIRIPTNELGL